ncbi:hypothetical protein FA95DRAFT_1205420 [Auriscalpium vulgare]|uniref:Uncharacterized protein n=1 Tax=Auriscalpium vulgare TaxID=40419 RepID=A0ACB8RV38_9AGAM|nr:hypothetical protein FA95DRAFT_1205420 [Auriscalpium vulgare]
MGCRAFPSPRCLVRLALLFTTLLPPALAKDPEFLEQGFFFDWNPPGTTIPVPVTAQCDTLHITWERGSATGPNPTAPYYLQIYTSAFIVPFIIPAGSGTSLDFSLPFNPGTQYQICMFDSKGVTGGCQGLYTVIPAANATTQNPPTCTNVTFPAGAMDVDAAVANGAFSQYGWINECTDISVTAKNGTPPYTFTIAPTLHPPLNITSQTAGPINWTVSLSHGFPFFISLADSVGNTWSQGPLHSGEGTNTACLDLLGSANAGGGSTTSPAVIAGAAVGSLIVGVLLGLGLLKAWQHHRLRREFSPVLTMPSKFGLNGAIFDGEQRLDGVPLSQMTGWDLSASSRSTQAIATGADPSYHVEPFVLPAVSTAGPLSDAPMSDGASVTAGSEARGATSPTGASQQHVYVVHHDAGRAPVTVYTQAGTEVVELPPLYRDSPGGAGGASGASGSSTARRLPNPHAPAVAPDILESPRQPGVMPRKPRRDPS